MQSGPVRIRITINNFKQVIIIKMRNMLPSVFNISDGRILNTEGLINIGHNCITSTGMLFKDISHQTPQSTQNGLLVDDINQFCNTFSVTSKNSFMTELKYFCSRSEKKLPA